MRALNKQTGQLEKVYVKALDSMPVGTIVEFNGQASDIPSGWEEVSGENKIRKVSLKTPTGAHIVDGYSTSTTDGYSCNEANTLFQTKGQVLWTNPNPTSQFDSQFITLSSSDYDCLDIIYKNYLDSDTFEVQRFFKDYMPSEIGGTFYYNNNLYTGTRKVTSANNGLQIGFGYAQGIQIGQASLGADLKWIVPQKIIGYKN